MNVIFLALKRSLRTYFHTPCRDTRKKNARDKQPDQALGQKNRDYRPVILCTTQRMHRRVRRGWRG
ncbi:ribosomal protein L13e [Pseudomonas sp. ICMP 460]|uniref:ribosomal protein L13e n=1 Tax=Pseudomonas sp. ICMP 460 TaxID=1718917 RepID=UPI00353254EC